MANSTTFNIILKGIADFKDVASNIDAIQKNLNQLKLPADLKSKFTGIFSDLEKESAKYQKYLDSGFKAKGDITGLEKTGNRIKTLFESLASTMQKISPDILKDSFVIDTKQFDDLTQKIQKAKQEMSDLANQGETAKAFQNIQTALEKISGMSKSKSISAFSEAFKAGNIEEAQAALAKLYQNASKFGDGKQTEFRNYLDSLSGALQILAGNTALQDKQKELQGFISQLSTLEKTQIENFFKNFESFRGSVSGQAGEWNKYRAGVEGAASSVFDLNYQMDQLKHRIGYFFGITNILNLFKRTVREAINTVKELDAVMTETAVVTDFTVGDMWDKLPQYASQANALGASIKDLYAATTLYYQQGLQTDAAMSVGVETMKMARIAGMEAADATTAMTAALRGFNMEVNEMNAQRVNDVYSELAAITAADTNQIATAMGKTASIANSANMEFETTAALLAQIIETTQEAPETAGTAMKTIIARFTEVKQLFSEGMLTGKDEEGEEININKIDAALKTVGISLKDFLNGSKGIDDIFLELASKWDTLDLATQRYIATMAAGSRQQSRFIAMMSNYDRTMELVGAANNSAGASQEQFDKTLESMEAKLQNLKNAWDQFVMGLANNDLLKAAVDGLTGFLNAINGIISGLSGENGATKSIVSLLTVVGALMGGRALAKGFFEPGTSGISLGYGQGFRMSLGVRGSAVDQVVGADSTHKARLKGEQDGIQYRNGFQRAAAARQAGGNGWGAFFAKTETVGYKNTNGNALQTLIDEKFYATDIQDPMSDKLAQLSQDLEQGNVTADEAAKKFTDLGYKIGNVGEPIQRVSLDFSSMGMAVMGAGTAISLLGRLFDSLGLEGASEVLSTIGSTVTGIGGAMMMLSPLLNDLNISITGTGISFKAAGAAGASAGTAVQIAWWPLILIAIAIAAAFAAVVTIINNTPTKKLERATESAKRAEEAAKDAATGFQELNDSINSLEEQAKKIDNLTQGTKEWKKEVNSLNEEMLNLIDTNPELAPFVKNENGVLTLDKSTNNVNSQGQTYEEVMTNKEYQALQAQTVATQANLKRLEVQSEKDLDTYFQSVDNMTLGARNAIDLVRNEGVNFDYEDASSMDMELAKAVASGKIRGLNYDDSKQAYNENQAILTEYIAEEFEIVGEAAELLANQYSTSIAELENAGHKLLRNEAEIGLYNDQLRNQIFEAGNVSETSGKTLLEQMDSSIVRGIYDHAYETIREDMTLDKEERERYAEMMGYKHLYGQQYEVNGQKTKIKNKEVKDALAAADAAVEAGIEVKKLTQILSSKSTTQKDLILDVMGGEEASMSADTLTKYGSYDLLTGQFELAQGSVEGLKDETKASLEAYMKTENKYIDEFGKVTAEGNKFMAQAATADQLAKDMGFTDLQAFADVFNLELHEAVEQISSSFEAGGDAFLDVRTNVIKKMKKYDSSDKTADYLVQHLKGLEDKFGEEFVDMTSNIYGNLELTGDEALVSAGAAEFMRVASETSDITQLEQISDFVGSVNWGNSIEAAAALREEIQRGSGAAKDFAQTLSNAQLNYLSIGSQTQTLFKSEQFSEIQGELDEILKTSTEISASDVKELSKSYKILDTYLKNTEITASGLARALTEVSEGNLRIEQLTTSVMSALSSFNSLEDTVANVIDELENFDLGMDENQIAATVKEWYEVVNSNLEKGAYGNSQNDKIFDYLFGPDWDKDLATGTQLVGEEFIKRQQELAKFMKDNQEDFSSAWSNFANDKNWNGEALGTSTLDLKTLGANPDVVFGKDGGIEIKDIGAMTTKQLSQWVSEVYGVTENMAEMMIGDLSNFSTDIKPVLEENDYQAGIQAAIDNGTRVELQAMEDTYSAGIRVRKGRKGGEYTLIDEQEIQAIHETTGRAYEEIKADLESRGALITNFFDKEGVLKQGQELFNEINKVYGEDFAEQFNKTYTKYAGTQFAYKEGYYDLAGFDAGLDSFGFNQTQKDQIVNEQLAQLTEGGEAVEVEIEADNGEFVKIMAEAGDTIDELREKANMSEEMDAFAESMKNAILAAYDMMGEINITYNGNNIDEVNEAIQGIEKELGLTADTSEMTEVLNDWVLDNQGKEIGITIKPSAESITITGAGEVINLQVAAHRQGIVNSPTSHMALTGEEGPELVQTKNGAYLVGQNGPEMAHINKGDTVYTAEETKKIFKGSNPSIMPRFSDGQPGSRTITGYTKQINGKTSGGKGADADKWETSIDKLYNLLRDIDEELRHRERLERRYTSLLDKINTNASDLIKVSRESLAQLNKERDLQQQLIAGRAEQINTYQQEKSGLNKYAWTETDEHGNMVLRIDWEAIEAISNEEKGKEVEDYIKQLEDWVGDIDQAQDTLDEISDAVREIYERGKDEYFDFESQIKEALIDQYQEEIDKLSEINDTINDTNSRLLDSIQDSIDEQRQARDNAKTEEELADKQRRLSYLQMDTSGANALEILELQEEIAQGEEDYTDTLIDQKINELQQQNDEAAQQRERQIEIAQEQLDHWVKTGEVWNAVYGLLATGIDDDGIISGSDLEELLKDSANFKGMSELEKVDWLETLEDTAAQALHWLEVGNQLENLDMKDNKIDFITADGTKLSGTIDKDGNITADGKTYKNIYRNYDGTYVTREEYEKIEPKKEEVQSSAPPTTPTITPTTTTEKKSNSNTYNKQPWYTYEKTQGAYIVTYQVYKDYSQKEISRRRISEMRGSGAEYFYASGGLADFTGPAWLDGTKSRPEYVLNADQTRAFFTLVDVLEALRIGTSKTTENSGDINYDIDINVESIGSDYDVEQMAGTIKRLINDDARYRNNNAINLMR